MALILIIEYDQPMLTLVGRVCERMGHQISPHRTGRPGIAAFIAESPDLVITQLHIPDVNGIGIIQACRAHDPRAKVLVLSPVCEGVKGGEEAVKLGAVGYMVIPFELADMEQAIREALATGGSENQSENAGKEASPPA
jgi:DNA-binding NtrC family response regulator